MNRAFEVICESEIWTIQLDGFIYGEHETKESAVREAETLATQHGIPFVVYDNAQIKK